MKKIRKLFTKNGEISYKNLNMSQNELCYTSWQSYSTKKKVYHITKYNI